MAKLPAIEEKRMNLIPRMIFASRWLQLPLYLGLIAAQVVYVFLFWEELSHLIQVLWRPETLPQIAQAMGIEQTAGSLPKSKETIVMLIVLGLIDVVMISNLLIMVIVGGYETFVSRMRLGDHPDQPEWLSHVNANVLKVKLATAIIGISSIHLLKTFIDARSLKSEVMMWQTIIHMSFIASAIGIAYIDKLMHHAPAPKHSVNHDQPELH
jgi:uncharacterized protein (TIGR00645 family)